jgi:hypothetical protein
MNKSTKICLLCVLLVGSQIASGRAFEATAQTVIVSQTYSPAIKIDPRTWLVKIVSITGLPKSSGLVMHIPCLTTDPSAGNLSPLSTTQHYEDYWCVPQTIPSGPYKGLLLDKTGQIFAKPPQ